MEKFKVTYTTDNGFKHVEIVETVGGKKSARKKAREQISDKEIYIPSEHYVRVNQIKNQ